MAAPRGPGRYYLAAAAAGGEVDGTSDSAGGIEARPPSYPRVLDRISAALRSRGFALSPERRRPRLAERGLCRNPARGLACARAERGGSCTHKRPWLEGRYIVLCTRRRVCLYSPLLGGVYTSVRKSQPTIIHQ